MNEQKAREIYKPFEAFKEFPIAFMKVGNIDYAKIIEAKGYLECLEKARGLEKALEKISKYECGCFSGCGPCLDIANRVAAETLSKWQEEK